MENNNGIIPTEQEDLFVDRQGENLNRKVLNIVSQTADKIIVDVEDGANVSNPGTPFNAAALNNFNRRIETSNTKAENSVTTAGQANTKAESAMSKADEADARSVTANTNSESAIATANSAHIEAVEAKTISTTANTKADKAVEDSTTALNKANDALNAVETKQGTAVYKNGQYVTQFNADDYLAKSGGTLTGQLAASQVNAQLKTLILNEVWCNTAADVAAKTAVSSGGGTIIPPSGIQNYMIIDVVFENGVGGVPNPTLNIDGTGAKTLNVGIIQAGDTIRLIYNQATNSWDELENLTRSQLFREYVRATNINAEKVSISGGLNNGTQKTYGKLVINPSYDSATNSYNEGVRINKATNGWAGIYIGAEADTTSGETPDIWCVSRRGSDGKNCEIGDLTIECGSSDGSGITVKKNGQLQLSENGLKTEDPAGYYTDEYGNFHHLRSETGDSWGIFKANGEIAVKVVWETGEVSASKVYGAVFN